MNKFGCEDTVMARLNKKDIEYNNSAISEIKITMRTEKNLRHTKDVL